MSGNEAFIELTRTHEVGYVPVGHVHAYAQAVRDGTTHVITGGGRSTAPYVCARPDACHHQVQVIVQGEQVETRVVRLE